MEGVLPYVDLVSIAVLAVLSFYGFRTAIALIRMPETERIRDLWLPIIGLPLLLSVTALGHLIQDFYEVDSVLFDGVSDIIVLVAATLLTYSLASFYNNWNQYKKERDAVSEGGKNRDPARSPASQP